MDNKMNEYYKILQYLKNIKVDRQYPCTFNTSSNLQTKCSVSVSNDYNGDFNKSYRINRINNGDKIYIPSTKPHDYSDIDTFEIMFYSKNDVKPSDITIGFSNVHNGSIILMELTEDDLITEESVIGEGYNFFKYKMRKNNTQMQKKNRKLSNIFCIVFNFKKEIPLLYLSNLVLRVENYNLTLEDLDDQLDAGQQYVVNHLFIDNFNQIPVNLRHLSYKAAAAYSWLIYWENEGKVMNDGTNAGRNYATRLFNQIDTFLDNFIKANSEYKVIDEDTIINMNLVGSKPLHKKPKPPKYWKGCPI